MHYQQGTNRNQLVMMSYADVIAPDAFVRLIDLLVDVMPLSELGFTHTELKEEGAPPFYPGDLLKLWLYGYRNGLRSGRKLSKACLINLEVKWLVKDLRPSTRTINYFRSNNAKAITAANKYFIQLLKDWDFIEGKLLAVDSTKIDGQNSLKNNFNEKKVKRHLDYLEEKIERINQELDDLEEKNESKRNYTEQEELLSEELEQAVDRVKVYEDIREQVENSEDGQVSLTDPDARAVIVKRNIVKVGYSLQATVDAKHKMLIDLFIGGVNDLNDLGIAGKRAQKILGEKHFDLLADAGYYNGAEIGYTERLGIRTFVAPRKQKEQSKEGFRKRDFTYDEKRDIYLCPANEELIYVSEFERGSVKRPYKVRRYGTLNCAVCPLREQCTSNAHGRFIERPSHEKYVERHNRRFAKNKKYYRKRQAIVEHIFGTLKRSWKLDYAHLKSKEKVLSEYSMASILYNLQRLVSIEGMERVKKRLKSLILSIFDLTSMIDQEIRINRIHRKSYRSTYISLCRA